MGKVARYSSRGPTRTSGRLKPDVVAPGGDHGGGYTKYGVVSTNAKNESGFWLDNAFDRWPSDSYYTRMAGTSMAAPHVSGTVALINESYSYIGSFSDGIKPRDYKALLIGDAIPLKGYGINPSNGYANTDVGYGLIDAYFSIFDRYGEKETLLWAHGGLIDTISNTQDWDVNINGTEKKIAIVLAYEDDAGQINATHVLKDDIDLRIISPNGTEFNYTLPAGVTSEEPEEKIVIDNPPNYGTGTWTIRVEGASWDSFPLDSKKYTVVVNAYYVEPSLGIEITPNVINVAPGANFTLSLIRNTGGLTAAGVTVSVSTNVSGFGGDINNETFVGNLVGNGSSKSVSYNITAPLTVGEYQINISANGINHDLNKPNDKTVRISVGMLSGWNYQKQKNITGSTAGAQTNYQMKLTVYNSTGTDTPGNIYLGGNAKSDFSDLRFTKSDGVALLDYWIESYTSGINATVWVEVDSIPASPNNASIYLYYGNSLASSLSNIHNAFLFGDDFEDNSWTANNWNLFTGGYTLVSATQRDGSTGKVLKSNSSSSTTQVIANVAADNIVIEANVKPLYDAGGTINYGVTFRDSSNLNTVNYFKLEYLNWGPAGHNLHYLGCGSETRLTGTGWTTNNWYILQAQISGSSLVMKLYDRNGNLMRTITKTTSCGLTNTWLGIYSGDYSGNTAYYDAFKVRKYASPEPAWGS